MQYIWITVEELSNKEERMTQQVKPPGGQKGERVCTIYKKRSRTNKKGFRIDDILFHVSNSNSNLLKQKGLFLDTIPRVHKVYPSSPGQRASLDEMSLLQSPRCHATDSRKIESSILPPQAQFRSISPCLPHSSSKYTHLCVAESKFICIMITF